MSTVLLKADENGESSNDGVIFLPSLPLPPGYKEGDYLYKLILFIPASCKIARDGIVWANVPPNYETEFRRDKFYKNIIPNTFTSDIRLHFKIYRPGPYAYYISYRDSNDQLSTTRKFYFVVPPSLKVNDEFLPLNSIALESVVSKWLGPRSNWDEIFEEITNKGYNMIHFTPLQERGESNSPYSIYDQLKYDPQYFENEEDALNLTQSLHKNKRLLSITDIVFNHTANNSKWLREHPSSGYNAKTAPHLTSAIELDGKLLEFSSNLPSLGYPTNLTNVEDLLKIMDGVKQHVIDELKLWEFYVVDVQSTLKRIELKWPEISKNITKINVPEDIKNSLPKLASFVAKNAGSFTLKLRYDNNINIVTFLEILNSVFDFQTIDQVKEQSLKLLDEINLPRYQEYDNDIEDILEQIYNRIKFLRIDGHGPKLGEITEKSPLTEPYFTRFRANDGEEYALANNGWIWNGNPLIDFASDKSKSYLLREVIIWGDCVKLRYGSGPEDSPYLWDRIANYVRINARVFDGFRIDNCHSTPLHVGEHFLDIARRENPNLYIVAELFSGSEQLDNMFVERLGISSLIREAMQAWSVDELSRLVHRHAGLPIGSFQPLPLDDFAYPPLKNILNIRTTLSEIQIPRILTPTKTHALFMDCTHDNETPFDKRTVEDTLPNAALVSLCYTAVGSVFGYDECYPHLLDVVNEKRTYTFGKGIGKVKSKLYEIRKSISDSSSNAEDHEMHVHHEEQYITLQRLNAKSGEGWFLIARTKFSQEKNQRLEPIILKGTAAEFELGYLLEKVGDPKNDDEKLTSVPVEVKALDQPKIEFFDNGDSKITLPDYFPQGSIIVLKTHFNSVTKDLDDFIRTGALESTRDLTLYDLNALLYKCESEERDASAGNEGIYVVPGHGRLVYAGLQGWISVLRTVIQSNDLAHPVSEHLRNGLWALDHTTRRLNKYGNEGVNKFREWLDTRLERIKKVPFFLAPRYFALVIGLAYEALRAKALSYFRDEIQNGNLFVQRLALTSVQMVGFVRSTSLTPFKEVGSLAAGLPHFSYDYMRCWGRDVFISLRGLLLATGRFEDAKNHILYFAATLKHGLIPNLLDAGRNPRYNARDAAWFFLQSVQDYINIVPGGELLLKVKVKRRFPLDDRYITYDDPEAFSYETSIEEIIYEILSRHAKGIKYREANAGPRLDEQMKDEGFNVEVKVDWNTGLVHGGSQWNCGTWMDKMGESVKAHSKGFPGTPRDGAAIEINGLLKSSLRFVIELRKRGLFKYESVTKNNGEKITLKEWDTLIQKNFERSYYIPLDPSKDSEYDIDSSIVNRRGIYKDLYKSGKSYEDYQLRANFAIAMVVAPELFTHEKALKAIQIADGIIRGPLGIRTLDPSDLNYRPYYFNSDDSEDFATSKGRNYHQGPEWVWVYGYFLRAFYKFHAASENYQTDGGDPSSAIFQLLTVRLKHHRDWIRDSEWAGLPELTNKDGELCGDSSPTQAWSSSCLLDLYLDLFKEL
ncbi:hypothetical protein WICMUC_005486 [Wickerhamomyces mucosus]|uniref:Glycogen debranching enzyme n=1 Tax=Wickerhamomyces mucosus TaxID=1378264 RepID=A0A9P8P817_9ASCO|nr:hypothetical protein WICMUC_005486 [Wickerhamomyces mucosus]